MNDKEFKPYIPAEKITPEMTATSVIMGVILAIVFGAANAYLGLRVGMTVSASIPAAVISMGVLNLMPWAGPTMRAATVLGIEAGSLWQTILPIQACGIVLALAVAVLNGIIEQKRGAGLNGKLAQEATHLNSVEEAAAEAES